MYMDNIANLKEALQFSPTNIPLKMLLANSLFRLYRFDEAKEQFKEIINIDSTNIEAKIGLSKIYFNNNEFSKSIVILDDILKNDHLNVEALLLYTKVLVKENSISEAIVYYQKILSITPSFKDEELDAVLKISNENLNIIESEDFEEGKSFFTTKPKVNFEHVGGMYEVKKEIELKIIHPLNFPDLYKAYGKKAGGGILLYGPPGCGKTFIAKATAGQINSNFISVGLNDILDMWVGNSEKNLHEVFEYARKNKPCVLFFDEIDALGASRSDMKHSSNKVLINQFLQELDGVDTNNDGVLILGATNAPWHLDNAFRRPGRFDRIIFVPPPDDVAKASILEIKLKDKPTDKIDFQKIIKSLQDFSGADIEAVIDIAIEEKLQTAFKTGIPEPISTSNLIDASKKHRPSTKEWFQTAKNFALYSNESGLYDPILAFLKIKK
ncbi:ATP-binding protein [Flavobacterium piscinae]|uniref:ATP-binding protein n=2 Tax=Flavobacterium piscinae TaxID=2506424 RepID=A0A4Q1KSN2_9FLAO|nr:ATP-binding protein [Flavobacterium piscinae]